MTVFRSVYLHGEAPSMRIDPNLEEPEGLESASAKREWDTTPASTVHYGYDASGRLVTLTTDAGRLG